MRSCLLGVLLCLVSCAGELTDGQGSSGQPPSEEGHSGKASGASGAEGSEVEASGGAGSAAGQPDSGPYVASTSLTRRLTRVELDNALRDLLGDATNPASATLPEDPYSPYDNAYIEQRVSGALIDSLSAMAEDVSIRAVADPTMRARLVTCTPTSPADEDCFMTVVRDFTTRAFRRPMEQAELERYLSLLEFAADNDPEPEHGFDSALALLVQAVLQDPEFLYRIEIGSSRGNGLYALSDYEIASRLSFLLWGTIPDDELLADAEAGRLQTAQGRLESTRRMLMTENARKQLQRFHAMWLGYRAVPHEAALASAFQRETSALIDRVVFDEPQRYINLFTFAETYIDEQLADHYGLPVPGAESWVSYGDSGRAGLLSHGSFLSAFGKFSDTSPTQRGILVRSRLLCQEIAPPPPTVMADQPPSGDEDAQCKYERYEAHRSSNACAGCHAQMDPIGFGLENYDLAGRFRTHDDGLPECTIDGVGELPPYGAFSGPAELGALLVGSGELERCAVKQFATFALGREPEGNEMAEVARLTAEMEAAGGELIALIEALVASESFALRMEPAVAEVSP